MMLDPTHLVLGVCLTGCTAPAEDEAADTLFEQHEIVIGPAARQTVLTGFLLGGELADLAVVHVDENDDRRLRIFAAGDGTWVAGPHATLRPGVLFVDVANIAGRDRLITYERGRLHWFDPESATETTLAEVHCNFSPPTEGEIPHVDVTRDLNHDGRDDLVVPDLEGFWISTQREDGSFTTPRRLGPPEPFLDRIVVDDGRAYREVGITALTAPWYLSRVHQMDADLDGRIDLVFWNEDHLDVHLQDEHGQFDPIAQAIPAGASFDSDGAYSRMFDFQDQGALSVVFGLGDETSRTVLHSFHDLNGDQVNDLITLTLSGRSITRQHSRYAVHPGRATADGLRFARDASIEIQPRGVAGGMQPWGYSSQHFQDLDGDGRVDVLFRNVASGFSGMSRALVGNSVGVDLEFYRATDGTWPEGPGDLRKIRPQVDLLGRRGPFFPTVLLGDVNGDGRVDLLAGSSRDELAVYLGAPGPGLFAREPRRVAVAIPDDERRTWLASLNRDLKQDILVHRRSGSGPDQVTMLIAR